MPDTTRNILFLCTGNSARSILAEAIVNAGHGARFTGWSAGSKPTGTPHPLALELLGALDCNTSKARSKSWDEFAGPDAPVMHYVFTVCDAAASEECPFWPGHPATGHWGLPDPAKATGSIAERRAAFRDAYEILQHRISLFCSLEIDQTDSETLRNEIRAIGQSLP